MFLWHFIWFYLLFCLYNRTFVFMKNMRAKKKHRIMRFLAGTPLRVLYVVSDLCFLVIYYCIKYRRDVVRRNLCNSFPDYSMDDIISIEKGFYHNLCDIFIESFKALNISDAELKSRIEVVNCELPERIASQGKNIYLLMGHCGCWEWVQEISTRYSLPKRNAELYKHVSSSYFSSLMNEIRGRWNTILVDMHDAARTLLKWSREDTSFLIGLISDQRPDSPAKGWVNFLSQRTGFIPGAEEFASKLGGDVLYLDIERISRGHYRFTFKEMVVPKDLANETFPITRLYWRMLEKTIRRQPELWLWSHNRWA